MIIHGILYAGGNTYRGVIFAYRPATGTWAKLASGPAPKMAQTTDTAVWTGSEMLVLGLTSAAYNPARGTWRLLARGPYPAGGAAVAWTGHQVIIWGGVCCAGLSADGASYTPATDAWQKLPTAPLQPQRDAMGAWTGKEMIVAGGYTGTLGSTQKLLRNAAAYNPVTRTWRKLPPMPGPRYGATAVWDGIEVLFLGGMLPGANVPSATAVAYNPATNRWRSLPAMEFGRSQFAAVRTGRHVLVWGGMTGTFGAQVIPPHGSAYNPVTNQWSVLPQAPLRGRANPTAVWTGSTMIVWGGQIPGALNNTPLTDGAAYTPGTQ
jgi:N-acetylneuraminic acid mutarotase